MSGMGGARTARAAAGAALLAFAVLAGCGGADTPEHASRRAPRHCVVREGRPDPRCTPGGTVSAVTQVSIHRTICRRAWVRSAPRLPAARLAALEGSQLRAYGFYAGHGPAAYVEDVLIPAALGGRATDPRNLWPQARAPAPAAAQKDELERTLHRAVCTGATTLAAAQRTLARDWSAAYLETTG